MVKLGIDKIENTLHLMVFPSFPGSHDISEYIGDGKVFNYDTDEEITDEIKKNEIINELRKSLNQYVTHVKQRKDKLDSLCENIVS